jgi:Reverse transcriptase (RNA-dependent DNA polymerase)
MKVSPHSEISKGSQSIITYLTCPLTSRNADDRNIKALSTRRIVRDVNTTTSADGEARTELDSHADTCLAGSNCLKVEETGKIMTVHSYDPAGPIHKVPIATAATVYTDPTTGEQSCLVFHNTLFFGDKVSGSLLNPNQLRAHGIKVDDVPRQFDRQSTHAIHAPEHKLVIPLHLRGVMSGFDSRKPTWDEYRDLPKVIMTSPQHWEPDSVSFAEEEDTASRISAVKSRATLHLEALAAPFNLSRQITAVRTLTAAQLDIPELFDGDLSARMIACVNVAPDDISGDGYHGHVNNEIYAHDEDRRKIQALSSSELRSVLTPEILSRRWGIGLVAAKRTLAVTTQAGVRNVLLPSERKVRQRLDHLRFPTLKGRFYTDTLFAKNKSLRGHVAAQIFTNGLGYDRFYPMPDKKSAPDALMQFIHDDGIPQLLVSDYAPEEIGGEFKAICQKFHINRKTTVPHSPWRNLAEAAIRENKVAIRKMIRRTGAPRRTWCFAGERAAALRRLSALDIPQLEGRTPTELVTGSTPDISAHALFDFYEPVYYMDPARQFPFEKKRLGFVLGVYEATIDEMAYYILGDKGKVVVRKSIWGLSDDERQIPQIKINLLDLTNAVNALVGDKVKDTDMDPEMLDYLPSVPPDLFDDISETHLPSEDGPTVDIDHTPESYDQYLASEVLLPFGGEYKRAKVRGRKRDADGLLIGIRNDNPMFDTRQYEVEFPDGSTETFTANLIAENIYSQIDSEGHSFAVMNEIVDHRSNGHALSKDDGTFRDKYGRKHMKITTRGWDLQVEWKDGTTDWIPLKDLKESNPIEVAEYAVANKISEEPAFAWWVRGVLRKRDRIISKVASRYWKRTHKFGVELPKTVAEALAIDKKTGTDFWRRAIEKEMKNVMPAFEFRDDDEMPIGYKLIECHMIFDVKMVGLVRKARLVAGGHKTDPPKDSTYSSVVSRDSVRIAFLIAALNDLDILSADVQNAYLNAPTKERVYCIAGLEFGSANVGRPVLIVRALYGLKSSGARWRDHMAATLRDAGFKSCQADPDMWMRPQTKPNGDRYYEYVLCYVDDLLVLSHDPQSIMNVLSKKYTLKEGSVKEPDMYLGAEIRKWQIGDDPKTRWAISSDMYVKQAIADVETELALAGEMLVGKVSTPISPGYRPEIDSTPELNEKQASYYQGLIGVLRWICELGRIDIIVETSLMSRFLANPRQGHLDQVLHIFAYLKKYNKSALVMDETVPEINDTRFNKVDWTEFYPGAAEAIPPDAPESRGKSITMTCFVDADHAGCLATRRSHTGVLIFLNRAPILWYSKRQNTVESSTFGSEFIAAKTAVDMVEGLRYKLRMLGIPIDGPTDLFGDNESVVKNATRAESTLKKKHNAIAYHRVREAQAAGFIRFAHESGTTNLADILTKPVPGPRKRYLSELIMW